MAYVGSVPQKSTALGLDLEWVAQARQALSEEPFVTNRRFGT